MYAPTKSILSMDDNNSSYLTVVINGESKTIRDEDPNFYQAVEAYREASWELLHNLMNPKKLVEELVLKIDNIEIKGSTVYFDGRVIDNIVVTRLLELVKNNQPIDYLAKFLQNLMKNPSYKAIHSLYQFLELKNLPITDRGTFVAYKSVRENYTDHFTGTISNKVGDIFDRPRNDCDDETKIACSRGGHIGEYRYASTFNGMPHLMLVECNPADVVSVPDDASQGKLRTCKYVVLEELFDKKALTVPVYITEKETSSVVSLPIGTWAILRDKYKSVELKKILMKSTGIGDSTYHRSYRKKAQLELTITGKQALEELDNYLVKTDEETCTAY